ncbi:acyl-CoA desaturase [Paraflavisolibacter sp. H34]|uniref:fatty acid desaturase family protein n=1 Tax=Huijunlia imazamoxiresistens TaxID=3127457 RepID=UPI003019ED00
MAKVTFNNTNNQFFQSLKQSVERYFKTTGLKKTGNWRLYLKTLILVPLALGLYITLLAGFLPPVLRLPGCALLGFAIACIGFNVMHDACHGSYCSRKWINHLLGLTMNAMGGNAFFWKQKHNILHHTYTNIEGADDDIAQSKLLRQSPTQQWRPIHRYQHRYLPLLYALTLFTWVSVGDFRKYFSRKIHNTPLQSMDRSEHITFWVSKLLYVVFYILLPILSVGPLAWLAGYLVMGVTTGIVTTYVFQLAHAVEGPEFDSVGMDDRTIQTEWAIHQIRTTANFAPRNKVITWLAGGLNFQVEHHLFPRISHIHYPALSKIVEEHCQKFQLPYHCFPSLATAVASHVRTMKLLGQKN